jgi:glycosyltransferase involved in cell wall biosynthesis
MARPRRVATAITVHDMAHELHPSAFSPHDTTSARKRVCCEGADVVLAVSHYTKSQLVRFIDIDPERIVVCHHGVTRVQPDAAALQALGKSPPFLLYVGGRRGHKNFYRLAAAYSGSAVAADGTRLIAFGGGPPQSAELVRLRELGISQMVTFTSGNDASLAAHYAVASALLYPSIDEGFGFPPLEAMQHRCPVAAARAGAIPEVVEDAALLFDPVDRDAITESIDRIVEDSDLRARLSGKGLARASAFSWETAAKTTLAAYAVALERAGDRS